MSFYPNTIEQINDFSGKAGDRLVDVLGNAPSKVNYAQYILKAINDKTKADESQRLTEAVDAYNRAMEAGKSASEALEGLDPRMTGSKAFKDEADKIRASILNQRANDRAEAMWANTLKRQAMEDNANALLADMYKFKATTPGGAPIWLDRHQAELQANPVAYNRIMEILKGEDLSLPNVDNQAYSPEKMATLANSFGSNMDNTLQGAKAIINDASNLGIALSVDLEKSPYLKDVNEFIDHEAKLRGYTGEDYRDFAQNMRDAYNTLSGDYKNLPMEQILASMHRNLETSKWSYVPLLGRFAQDIIGDGASTELEALKNSYSTKRAAAEKALVMKSLLDNAVNTDAVKKEILNTNALIDKYSSQEKSGQLSSVEAERLRIIAQNALMTKLAPYGLSSDKINLWAQALNSTNTK